MARVVVFLIGFGFAVIGGMYVVTYLNLLTIGYNFLEYVKFISSRLECWTMLLGFSLIILAIYYKGADQNELCL